MKKIVLFLLILLSLSCVKDPLAPVEDDILIGKTGIFVLCEGLWGSDNSTLERIDESSGRINNSYYNIANPNMRLGDIASDIVTYGDIAFITISTPGIIEIISTINGKSISRITLPKNSFPRKIAIINDTTAFVTLLFKEAIMKFNPTTFELDETLYKVGPFPEGIAEIDGKLFIANSGYGDYFHHLPKSGTISVFSIAELREIAVLECGKNAVEVIANKSNGKVYAAYYHLPSQKDSLGGIVQFDAISLLKEKHVKVRATDITLSRGNDTLFFFKGNTDGIDGVYAINLNSHSLNYTRIIKNTNRNEIWYSLAQSPDKSQLFVGNAKRFQTDGDLLIFRNRIDSIAQKTYKIGVNPCKILFF